MWFSRSKYTHRVACEADELMEYYGWRAYDVAWKREQAAREKLRFFQFLFWRRVALYIWEQDRKNPETRKPKEELHTNTSDLLADMSRAKKLASENRLN
jgi:hypothetical protein